MVKKTGAIIGFIALLLLFIMAYFQKDQLNTIISDLMKKGTETNIVVSTEELIQARYNYTENHKNYQFTLLEFGSTGCTICKQMEPVLDEIRNSKSNEINVVFLHTMNPDNQDLIKYFGISAIPMQVLLDKNGKVFFKNYGFISAADIISKTQEVILN